jgi:hypothetical protein
MNSGVLRAHTIRNCRYAELNGMVWMDLENNTIEAIR